MKPARTFKDLLVWQKAHKFVLESYAYSKGFPKKNFMDLLRSIEEPLFPLPQISLKDSRKEAKKIKQDS